LMSSLIFASCLYAEPLFHDSQGHLVQLTKLKKWVVVNYWASWCPNCVEEIPELNRFYQHHKKNILVYGVNFDRLTPEDLQLAIQKTNIGFPVLVEDPKQAWQLKTVDYLPTTFIISPAGTMVKMLVGPNTEQSLLRTIHNLEKFVTSDTNEKIQ